MITHVEQEMIAIGRQIKLWNLGFKLPAQKLRDRCDDAAFRFLTNRLSEPPKGRKTYRRAQNQRHEKRYPAIGLHMQTDVSASRQTKRDKYAYRDQTALDRRLTDGVPLG